MGEMFIPPPHGAPKMETWRELAEKLRVRVAELEAENIKLRDLLVEATKHRNEELKANDQLRINIERLREALKAAQGLFTSDLVYPDVKAVKVQIDAALGGTND